MFIKEILKRICLLRYLGYVPGFCWNLNISHQKSFLSQWFSFSWWDMWSFLRFSPLWTGKSHSKHPLNCVPKVVFEGGFRKVKSLSVVSLREGDFAMPLGQILPRTCEACFFCPWDPQGCCHHGETLKKELISRETGRVVSWLFSSRTLGFCDPISRSHIVQMGFLST